jgi:hypothetical protein
MVLFRTRRRDECLRWTRRYLWNFNPFSPGKPCQKRNSAKGQLLLIIDLSMTPQFAIRLIVTRDRSFFKLASLESSAYRLHPSKHSTGRDSVL